MNRATEEKAGACVSGRDTRYDALKGLAIILVVVGHVGCATDLLNFICLFHMPIFFLVAGWFFKGGDGWRELQHRLVAKVVRLWVPYAVWTVLFAVLHNWMLQHQIIQPVDQTVTVPGTRILHMPWDLCAVLYAIRDALTMRGGNYLFFAPLWFLQTLLFALCGYSLADFALRRFRLSADSRLVVLSGLAMTLALLGRYLHCRHWHAFLDAFGGAKTVTAFALIHLGSVLKRLDLGMDRVTGRRSLPLGLFCLCGLVLMSRYTTNFLFMNQFHSLCALVLSSLLGWGLLLSIVGALGSRHGLLSYVGRHTMPILIFHLLAFRAFELLLLRAGAASSEPAGWQILCLYSAFGVVVPLLLNAAWWGLWTWLRGRKS